MKSEVQAVKVKIAKLMALSANNSNLAEAQVAMSKAGALMEEWALSIEDIELGDEKILHKVIETGRNNKPELLGITMALAEFLSLKIWVMRPRRYNRIQSFSINLIGYENDLELFEFFWDMLNRVYLNEYESFKNSSKGAAALANFHGRKVRASFRNGFVNVICSRLTKLAADTKTNVTKTGTALVPLKMGKIDEYFADHFNIRLRQEYNYSRSGGVTGANNAGAESAKKVNFNSPINGDDGSTKLLS
jgi:hypothetical protein